jgi:hypothetical protein
MTSTGANFIGQTMTPVGANSIGVAMQTLNFLVSAGSQGLVTNNAGATFALGVLYGIIGSNGSIINGQGFSVNHPSTGVYNISYSKAFNGTPAVVVSNANFDTIQNMTIDNAVSSSSSSSFVVQCIRTELALQTRNLVDSNFTFIVIGVRNA